MNDFKSDIKLSIAKNKWIVSLKCLGFKMCEIEGIPWCKNGYLKGQELPGAKMVI